MESFYTILFYAAWWVAIGIAVPLIKVFIFFRGPKHMLTLYLSHPRTAKHAQYLLDISKRDSHDPYQHIVLIKVIFGIIFMPLAVIDFLIEIITFYNYTPPTDNKDTK